MMILHKTIDLNMNQKYDYKKLDKNIDFIIENNSNNENNNTIGEPFAKYY